jgi:geranylgeranyl diphosphate synthase, type II
VTLQTLREFLEGCRTLVDEALDRFLPKPPACPPIVSEAMRYSVFAGGKRLRPILTLAAAEAIDPSDATRDLALPAACAVELIHTYSLIHDDLPAMDNDTLRRGRPTLHVVYGEGIAILAGDGLLAEAFSVLAREPRDDADRLASRKLRTITTIAQAAGASGMVGGQAIDLKAAESSAEPLDPDSLRAMHARKTGALIRASANAGGIMAGGSDGAVAAIDAYAGELGLAFQIVDDILDVEGDAAQLGKTAGKDAAAGKPTYPSLYGVDGSRRLARECVERAGAILKAANLTRGHLLEIAEWVVSRRN